MPQTTIEFITIFVIIAFVLVFILPRYVPLTSLKLEQLRDKLLDDREGMVVKKKRKRRRYVLEGRQLNIHYWPASERNQGPKVVVYEKDWLALQYHVSDLPPRSSREAQNLSREIQRMVAEIVRHHDQRVQTQ